MASHRRMSSSDLRRMCGMRNQARRSQAPRGKRVFAGPSAGVMLYSESLLRWARQPPRLVPASYFRPPPITLSWREALPCPAPKGGGCSLLYTKSKNRGRTHIHARAHTHTTDSENPVYSDTSYWHSKHPGALEENGKQIEKLDQITAH